MISFINRNLIPNRKLETAFTFKDRARAIKIIGKGGDGNYQLEHTLMLIFLKEERYV